MKTFCYWSVADKDHAKMAATMVNSARKAPVISQIELIKAVREAQKERAKLFRMRQGCR